MKRERTENGKRIAEIEYYIGDEEYGLSESEAIIESIWVDDSHRRQGIATELLNEAVDTLKAEGIRRIVIVAAYDTAIGIDSLVEFYKAMGFSPTDWGGENPILEMYL